MNPMNIHTHPQGFDFSDLQRELLSALRGEKSRSEINNGMNLSHNLYHRWESGKNKIPWTQFIAFTNYVDVSLENAFQFIFFQEDYSNPAKIVSFFSEKHDPQNLCSQLTISISTLDRWKKGKTDPSLQDILRLIYTCTDKLTDFLSILVQTEKLPSIASQHELLMLERNLQLEKPWIALIPRYIETQMYEALPEHSDGLIARALGISMEEERQALIDLQRVGVLEWKGPKLIATAKKLNSDDPFRPENVFRLHSYWFQKMSEISLLQAQVAKEKRRKKKYGGLYRVFAANDKTYAALEKLIIEFDQRLLSILNDDDNNCDSTRVAAVTIGIGGLLNEEE